jgi:Flp pilus assembly protein TadD
LKVIELDPLQAAAHEGAGLEHLALGDDASARERLSRALELDSQLWRAHNGLGILADRAGDPAAAIDHYTAAMAINPESPMLLNNIGYSRYLAGDLDQAARDFYAATQLRADYDAAWANLGMVYAQRRWYSEAVRVLSRTMDKAKAHNDVGYIAYRNGDLQESERLLREAVRLSPTYYQAAQQTLELVRAELRGESANAPQPGAVTGSNWSPGAAGSDEG